MKTPDLAKKSGVSPRMIAYVLKGERGATVEMADALAKPFGISGWQLMCPHIKPEHLKNNDLQKLIEHYEQATDKGREYIDHVAEQEARYSAKD